MPKSVPPPGMVPDRVHLSKTQKETLTDTADAIIAETLHANELFIANGRDLPRESWKLVKSKEKLHVYRSRRGKQKMHSQSHDEKDPSRPRLLSLSAMERQQLETGRPYSFDDEPTPEDEVISNTHSSSSDAGSFTLVDSILSKVKPSHVPLVVATGKIDGKVEDVGYGALAHTKDIWLKRWSYVKNDPFDDRKVLATIQGPSEEDPFRFVGLKWTTADLGSFVTRRDFVYLESMGMAFDSDGERVFYNLIHSVELDELPSLEKRCNIIRVQLSMCYITRKFDDETVEMFGRGFVDPRGDMLEGHGIMLLAQNVASCGGVIECSNLKKLAWLMAKRRRSDASGIDASTDCGVCSKPLNKLGGLLQSSSGCPICRRATCGKCSVQKKLTVDTTNGITQKQFTFCLSCVIEARELSAWDVATASLQ